MKDFNHLVPLDFTVVEEIYKKFCDIYFYSLLTFIFPFRKEKKSHMKREIEEKYNLPHKKSYFSKIMFPFLYNILSL